MQRMSIGELARASGQTVKRLRHYHDTGILTAERTDPATGYRWYHPDQVNEAVLVGRLRRSGIPLDEVGEILRAGDRRADLVAAALSRMRRELEQTRARVDEVALLLSAPPPVAVSVRAISDLPVVDAYADLALEECSAWFGEAYPRLYAAIGLGAGPAGACYGEAFFTEGRGPVRAFVPTTPDRATGALPGGTFAIAIHDGDFDTFTVTYAALGAQVHRDHAPLVGGDVREHYLIGPSDTPEAHRWRSEVCWPLAP